MPHTEIVILGVEPTCTEKGMSEGRVCKICGEFTVEPKILLATGHSGLWNTIVKPTCTEEGEEARKCTCGETEIRTVDALGHDYVVTETKEATCTETGELTYICRNDENHIYIENIPMGKHTEEVVPGKSATCAEIGLTEGKKCSTCGIVIVAQEELSTTKHDYGEVKYTWSEDNKHVTAKRVCKNYSNHVEEETVRCTYEIIKSATCTIKGIGKYTASFNNKAFETKTKIVDITLNMHKEDDAIKENVVTATCLTKGSYDSVVYCSVCGIEVGRETIITEKAPHSYGEVEYTWSKDNKFVTAKRICKNDANHVEEETVKSTYIVLKEATCKASGEGEFTAAFTNKAFGIETKTGEIPIARHTEEILPEKNATCTEEGRSKGKVCIICGEFIVMPEVLPVVPHEEVAIPRVEPTCTKEGMSEAKVCTVCGEFTVEPEVIPVVAHKEALLPRVEATCTMEGMTEGKFCSVCGEIFKEQEIIPAIDHNFSEWSISTEPTCTEVGEESRVCACGKIEKREVVVIDHVFEEYVNTTKAGFGQKGELTATCLLCKDKTDTKEIAAVVVPVMNSYTFDNKAKKPTVTVVDEEGNNIPAKVSYAKGRKAVGRYAVKITLTGDNYSGTETVYFSINPAAKSISKVSAGKKALTVKWKKASSKNRKQMTGYQIRYSTSSKMTKAKTVTVKSTSATSKTIKKLEAKKYYYVQIRTYKTVKGVKYYSRWSKAKKVKTK